MFITKCGNIQSRIIRSLRFKKLQEHVDVTRLENASPTGNFLPCMEVQSFLLQITW